MNNYPVIHPELTWRLLDGEAVVVSPTSGEIRVFNYVGAEIWQFLVDGYVVEKIETVLVNQYDLSPQQAHDDVFAFLDDLMSCGLITWESYIQ